jgi:hypothetical protein
MGQATQLSDKTVKEIAEQAAVRAIRRESTEGLTGITLTTGYRAADGFRTLGDIVGAAFSGKVGKFIGYFAAPIGATYADEMLPSSTSSLVKKSITGVSGGISGAMIGATVGAGAGGVGAIPGALIGFLVGATASLIADSADKTEMLIRWNSAQQTETLNVVISNGMDKTCGKLSDGSGLRLKDTTYSGSEINGWAMTSMAYAATECSIFDSVTSGGDFMVADILPIGLRVKCSGCFTISPGDMCGQKSTQWDGNSRMLSRGSSQPICCNECIRLDDDISDYFNMPATAGAGGQMTSSTVSVG